MSVEVTDYTPHQLEVNEALLDLGFQSIGFGPSGSFPGSTAILEEEPISAAAGFVSGLDYTPEAETSAPSNLLNRYQLIGDYDLLLPAPIEYISLNFTTGFFQQNWSNCGKLADMMANLFAPLCLHQAGPMAETSLDEMSGAISFVANELVENALKFHVAPTLPVNLSVSLYPARLVLVVANKVSLQAGAAFSNILKKIAVGDPTELLLEKMEENALDPEGEGSGLGILTILSDYQARAGWKFETLAGRANEQTVYSMVQLPLHEEASHEGN